VLGGNVRVGMEDNLYYSKGRLLKSNEEAVTKIRRMLEEMSVEIANPGDVREMLNFKGQNNTNFH
jgi:uncharacterized protein (DUF849 family)